MGRKEEGKTTEDSRYIKYGISVVSLLPVEEVLTSTTVHHSAIKKLKLTNHLKILTGFEAPFRGFGGRKPS